MVNLFPEGFEEREENGAVELAAYTERPDAPIALGALGPVRETAVSAGWEDAWRRFHRPIRIGRLWIGPSWEAPEPGTIAVVVDPGRAFGTGAHATTRLCLELLLGVSPTSLVDIGCGSGVIAVAAAKLGFAPVVALDNDQAAIEAARANAAANDVQVDVRLSDVLVDALPAVGLAVANVAREPVEVVAERFAGQIVIASGYLASEQPVAQGWRTCERRVSGEWAADRLERVG
jgi:ribosomal protein L11 methyltransferase